MHLPAILALANGSAHNGHEVVLGRIGDTLEGAIRAREPCQTCARSVGLTVVELLITKLALTRTSLASKRTRTALPQQRLNIHLVHGIAFIIPHILHLLAEKALLKRLLQKTGFRCLPAHSTSRYLMISLFKSRRSIVTDAWCLHNTSSTAGRVCVHAFGARERIRYSRTFLEALTGTCLISFFIESFASQEPHTFASVVILACSLLPCKVFLFKKTIG